MRKLLLFLALLFSAVPAHAALAVVTEYDSEDAAIDVTDVATMTINVPYTAGSNNVLFCGVQTLTLDATDGASGVTADATAMALVTGSGITSDGTGYDPYVEWWELESPTDLLSDSNIIVIVTLNTQSTRPSGVACYHLTGANTASPYGAVETGSNTTSPLSDSITTTTANSIVLQVNGGKGPASGATQDNGQTETMDVDEVGTDTFWEGSAYLAVVSAGATTMGVSSVFTDDNVQSLVEVKAAATTQISTISGVPIAQVSTASGVSQISTASGVPNS